MHKRKSEYLVTFKFSIFALKWDAHSHSNLIRSKFYFIAKKIEMWKAKKKEHKIQINFSLNKNKIYFWSNLSWKVSFHFITARAFLLSIFLLFTFLCVQFKCLVEIDDGENWMIFFINSVNFDLIGWWFFPNFSLLNHSFLEICQSLN